MLRLRRPLTDDFNARRLPTKRGYSSLLTPEQMRLAIERETARADRSGGVFAVVMFSSECSADGRGSFSARRLAKTVLNRVRATDDVGWYDEEHLCALLPDTRASGAKQFADAVCSMLESTSRRPLFSIYCYPSIEDKNHGNDRPGGGRFAHGESATVTAAISINGGGQTRVDGHDRMNGNGHLNGNGHVNGHGKVHARYDVNTLMPYFLEGVATGLKQVEAPVHRLENLLARPLPWWKRTIDVVAATLALILFSPVMLGAAIAIKLSSKGPILFKQRRAGLGGRPFTIYKLRTMCVDAEARKAELRSLSEQDGPAFKLTNDPRVTRVGAFLRKTSIDELPQFWNVLRGDMTIVGPRPLPINEQEACTQWQRRRLDVTPGLTCIWQVHGRSRVAFNDWVRMDVSYIRRRNLFNDLVIMAQTIPAVLLRRGAR
jgi:lipopolysaccharide/colanic/teichoic acid biosynthesis glycosyltransferase